MPRPRPILAAEHHRDGDGGTFSFLSVAGAMFVFLTSISAMALYYSKGDEAIVALVATCYIDLLLLVCCLWFYESEEPGSPLRNRLKASVWALTTLLAFCFAFMVGKAGLNLHLALLVWIIGAATGIGAFAAFFEQGSTPGAQGIPLGVSVGALIGFITVNSVMAVYHSNGDGAIVAFVATSFTGLLLLFACLRLYSKAATGSPRRNRLKALLWALTTLLTFSFCFVAMGMAGLTLPLGLLMWAIAAGTGIGAFSAGLV
ncbi:hypothetical protein ACQ4PT_056323 [Festuca glaucescens]